MSASQTMIAQTSHEDTDVPKQRDVLFENATIISGIPTEKPYQSSLLVRDGIIKSIAPDLEVEGDEYTQVIDATGLYLSPGFIDLHAHSDLKLLSSPDHEPKISQGCTTEVVGQDGIAYAPVHTAEQMTAIREQIAGWNGNPSDEECATTLAGVGMFEWKTVGEYLDTLDRNKIATNVAMLVPQGNLRLLTVGSHPDPATGQHVRDQIELLQQGMREGAIGMSSGLTYVPGMYAPHSELRELCQALVTEFPGAYYAPHHRSYGLNAIGSYQEMLDLAEETGCPVHLTHATLNFSENKGKAPELISMIDRSRRNGRDVTLDTYPYLPGCTTLSALLPSWAQAGGPAGTLETLKDPAKREEIRVAIEETGCDGGHGIPTNWDEIQVGSPSHPDLQAYAGRRISEIASSLGKTSIEVFFEILQKDALATSCIMHIGNEENVRAMMQHETHCSGSDGILHGRTLHPRAYGTMPRFIGHYARDEGLMSIPDMISHLTSRPAKRMGIFPHRGYIAPGSAADLVLFDPKTIIDKSTYEKPRAKAEGIKWVLVNGVVAVADGELTGARGGTTLRRGSDGKVRGRGE